MKSPREFTPLISAYFLLFSLASFSSLCDAYLMCEELPTELCAYSVSSSGARCVLEGKIVRNNDMVYKCQTSSMMGKSSEGWIESDNCMQACGLSRMTVGISIDSLFDMRTLDNLCATRCYRSCPHLFLLHNELAIAESGSSLEDVCKTLNSPHRFMGEFQGSHRDIRGHYGASRGNHGFFGGHDKQKDCGSFECGGGGFALAPETPTYSNNGGRHSFGDGGPHGRHGWKGGKFDNPFYPDYPDYNPSFAPSPSPSPSSFPSPSPVFDDFPE